MSSLFNSKKPTSSSKLKGTPVFNKERAIFLQEMEVIDTQVSRTKIGAGSANPDAPYLNQSLRNYFNQQPACDLRRRTKARVKLWRKNMQRV